MLAFFDWGEMVLWQLPDCSPSIDGRLDTCYPRNVISAHWNFYNGEPIDPFTLDISRADLAMLPANLIGTVNLSKNAGLDSGVYRSTRGRFSPRHPEISKTERNNFSSNWIGRRRSRTRTFSQS